MWYWLDTHSVNVWWRYKILNTSIIHFCDIFFSDIKRPAKNSVGKQKSPIKFGILVIKYYLTHIYRCINFTNHFMDIILCLSFVKHCFAFTSEAICKNLLQVTKHDDILRYQNENNKTLMLRISTSRHRLWNILANIYRKPIRCDVWTIAIIRSNDLLGKNWPKMKMVRFLCRVHLCP